MYSESNNNRPNPIPMRTLTIENSASEMYIFSPIQNNNNNNKNDKKLEFEIKTDFHIKVINATWMCMDVRYSIGTKVILIHKTCCIIRIQHQEWLDGRV